MTHGRESHQLEASRKETKKWNNRCVQLCLFPSLTLFKYLSILIKVIRIIHCRYSFSHHFIVVGFSPNIFVSILVFFCTLKSNSREDRRHGMVSSTCLPKNAHYWTEDAKHQKKKKGGRGGREVKGSKESICQLLSKTPTTISEKRPNHIKSNTQQNFAKKLEKGLVMTMQKNFSQWWKVRVVQIFNDESTSCQCYVVIYSQRSSQKKKYTLTSNNAIAKKRYSILFFFCYFFSKATPFPLCARN